ncbi:MAG: hypothetical protein H6581_19185 [Bacteroidia bacterium]|nr:hypothetical protein [Bacteroidia bacterium]
MQKLKYFLFLLWLIPALGWPQSPQAEYEFFPGKILKFDADRPNDYKNLEYVDGDGIVFEISSLNGGEPGNASECETRWVWQVEAKGKKFRLKDAKILEAQGGYWQMCITADRGFQRIEQGWIRGQLQDDGNWTIDLELEVKGHLTGKTYRLKLNELFRPG